MSSITGNILTINIFGESHGEYIGLTINNFPSGLKLNYQFIDKELERRRPQDELSTSRIEKDEYKFISGIFNDITTGEPITVLVKNNNCNSSDYKKGEIRPSHADLVSYLVSSGNNDYRGGGTASGRLTVVLVILGALCKQLLEEKGIKIATHIKEIHGCYDEDFDFINIDKQIDLLNNKRFGTLSENVESQMKNEILKAKENKDSVGGVLESVIINTPIGLGAPYFDSSESTISKLLFSIGGVKGVMFGDGEDFAHKLGSEVKDELRYENGNIKYLSNHNGGINGGISNGEPIIIKTIVKPTPSIGQTQKSINVETKENIDLEIKGRHDPCIVNRVKVIVDALLAYAILDMMMLKNAKNI